MKKVGITVVAAVCVVLLCVGFYFMKNSDGSQASKENLTVVQRINEKNLTDEEYEAQIAEKTSIWSINRDYLPKKVDTKALGKSYLDYRENKVYVLDGNATIINEKKEDLQLEFDIENYKANTILELPYIYYLGYTVTTGQNEKIQMFESDNGMLAIKLDENIESAHITVKYTGTTIEKVSYLISAISIITFIGYVIHSKKQNI